MNHPDQLTLLDIPDCGKCALRQRNEPYKCIVKSCSYLPLTCINCHFLDKNRYNELWCEWHTPKIPRNSFTPACGWFQLKSDLI